MEYITNVLGVSVVRSHIKNDNADYFLKMLYLAMMDITKKWTGKHRELVQIHSQLEIFFADRLS